MKNPAMTLRPDVIIIGAGVTGLGAGWYLSESRNVLVLEQESQPAYHSSGRSAALYIVGYESPEVSVLTQAGRTFFDSPPEDFGTASLLKARGGLTVGEPEHAGKMSAFIDRWRPLCPGLVQISPAEACALVPILRAEQVVNAAFDPDWYSIDVHALVMGYRRGILRRGGAIRCDAPVTDIRRAGQCWQVKAGDTFEAPVLINAAGAWAAGIAAMAGLSGVPLSDIPLQPMRRTAVLLPMPAGAKDWPSVHTLADDLYFKPEGNGLMLSPEDEIPSDPCDARPEEIDIALAVDHFTRLTGEPVNRLVSSWAGLRTFVPDRRPVIGPDPREPSFIWYAGLGGFGVQTSPGLAREVAACIQDGVQPSAAIGAARFNVIR